MGHIVADGLALRAPLAFGEAEVEAILSVAIAIVLALLVDRALRHAQEARVVSDRLDAAADTRLRFLRRVIASAIVLVGIALALAQFTALDRFAASLLASGAIAAAIVGFAARQTLANVVAGVLLAITQPLRLGDLVTFEGETGVVEDVRLTYTFLRTPAGVRVVIPNERLAAGILHNDSVLGRVAPEATIWLARDVDLERAIAAIEADAGGTRVTVAESAAEGTRLTVAGEPVPAGRRVAREAELRRAALLAAASTRPTDA